MSTEEAAEVLGVHIVTVRRWLNSGELPGSNTPAGWRITKDDIESWLEKYRSRNEKALIQRINRKLRPNCERLRKTRGQNDWLNLGDYYIVDSRNVVVKSHVDPEEIGRELGVLKEDGTTP